MEWITFLPLFRGCSDISTPDACWPGWFSYQKWGCDTSFPLALFDLQRDIMPFDRRTYAHVILCLLRLPRLHRSSQFTENSGKLPALPLSMRQVMRLSQVMGDPRFASKWFVMFGKPMVIRATPLYTPNFGPPNHHARNALRYASPRCWMRDQTNFACHTFAWQLCDKPYMPRSSYMGFSFLSSIPCHGNPSIVGMWLMTMPHINPSCRQTGANLWHPGISEVVHVPMGQSPRTLRTPK